jgi:ABC-type proline/glycine betaine transport system ATPase subunit
MRLIKGRTVFEHTVLRLKRSKRCADVIVCTSTSPVDDIVADTAAVNGWSCFRGSENDVMGRFYEAAKQHNVDLIVRAQGDNMFVCPEHIDSMLDKVGLGGRATSYPTQLSGGERRRLAIARALVAEPRAVLLDEPLVNIDVVLRDELLALLHDLFRTRETAALYVTHDLREAAVLADRIAVLENGRITQIAPLSKLSAAPATEFVRRLLDAGNQPPTDSRAASR